MNTKWQSLSVQGFRKSLKFELEGEKCLNLKINSIWHQNKVCFWRKKFEYWCKLNEYIARNEALEWGKLRTGTVGISGTDYEPPVPNKEKTTEELKDILFAIDTSATDKALDVFTWGVRGQFFWDGNKRTSLMLANKILVSTGAGIMTVTDKYMEQFNSLLLDYYNTGKDGKLKQFLYENAIQGMKL